MKKSEYITELAQRIYDYLDPWERSDYTPEDIKQQIENDPVSTISFLINLLEDN